MTGLALRAELGVATSRQRRGFQKLVQIKEFVEIK